MLYDLLIKIDWKKPAGLDDTLSELQNIGSIYYLIYYMLMK